MGLGVPGVPRRAQMLVGAPAAEGELHRVRLADDDHAGADQLLRQGGGAGGTAVAPHRGAAGRHAAFELDEVLERNRNAVQRPDGVARADGLVGRLRGEAGLRLVDLDEGVQLRVQPGDALEAGGDDVDRRDAARLELGGQRVERELGEICAHRTVSLQVAVAMGLGPSGDQRLARRSAAFSSRLAPGRVRARSMASLVLWLMPSRQGVKIMTVGVRSATA